MPPWLQHAPRPLARVLRPGLASICVRRYAVEALGKKEGAPWTLLSRAFNDPSDPEVRALSPEGPPTGLFGHEVLKSPDGFYKFAQDALDSGGRLRETIKRTPPGIATIELMDELSDVLCSVVDLSEFVRHTHPDPAYVEASEVTCHTIHTQLEVLNTDVGLAEALERAMGTPEYQASDDETKRTADLFMFDFVQSAIRGSDAQRRRVQQLTSAANSLGVQFVNRAHTPKGTVKVPARMVDMLPADVLNTARRTREAGVDYLLLPTTSYVSDNVLKWIHNPAVRKAMFTATYRDDPEHEAILEKLLQARHALAQTVGYPTYAHRALADTMAASPENVTRFLMGIAQRLRGISEDEMSILQKLKARHEGTDQPLMAWDRAYYTAIAKSSSLAREGVRVSEYFSLGGVMEGLADISRNLYGVDIVPVPTSPGEIWSDDVRKLAVVHESEGLLGYIYADLFARAGKSEQPSQYTVRSGRRISDAEYQTPVVALVCGFRPPRAGGEPTLLSHGEVETLFHEMGHAMHSMMGRTKYHHVAGTRCKIDFVEIPSILNEFFVWDYRVLSRFARHYSTGKVLPYEVLERMCQSRHMFAASEALTQVFYALFDQRVHAQHPLPTSTTGVLAQTQNDVIAIPHVPGTSWHLCFTHLFGYGASYYTYLWSKAIANLIWQQRFAQDPLNRQTGEIYRRCMLMPGGGGEPTKMVMSMLGFEPSMDMLVDNLVQAATSETTPVA